MRALSFTFIMITALVVITEAHKCRCGYYCHDPVLHSMTRGQLLPSLLCVEPEFVEPYAGISGMVRSSYPVIRNPAQVVNTAIPRDSLSLNTKMDCQTNPPIYLRGAGLEADSRISEEEFTLRLN